MDVQTQIRTNRIGRWLVVVRTGDNHFIGGTSSPSNGLEVGSLSQIPAATFDEAFAYLER